MARRPGSDAPLRVIALEQSLAGGIGSLLMLVALAGGKIGHHATLLLFLHGMSLLGGVWLWRGAERGVALSLLVQLLQLPTLQLSSLVYRALSGIAVSVGFDFTEHAMKTMVNVGADWQIETQPGAVDALYVGFDVVAAVMASILWKELRWRRAWPPLIRRRSPPPPRGTPGAPRPRRPGGSHR